MILLNIQRESSRINKGDVGLMLQSLCKDGTGNTTSYNDNFLPYHFCLCFVICSLFLSVLELNFVMIVLLSHKGIRELNIQMSLRHCMYHQSKTSQVEFGHKNGRSQIELRSTRHLRSSQPDGTTSCTKRHGQYNIHES